jgi:L-aspartate oxidase
VVVVGAGVAGLSAALALAPRPVLLLTKTRFGAGGSSVWAQGGVAAALAPDDDPSLHAADTRAAGAGIVDDRIADLLAHEGPERIARLVALGTAFDRDAEGRLALGREAAHSRRRILHAGGDSTGAEMVRALAAAVAASPSIEVRERVQALDLEVEGGAIRGLVVRSAGRIASLPARGVVLATGGIGRVYACTTNPREATGDGLAMAARAGARLADLEFVQFHPTALDVGADPLPLLTEALRGEGATLRDRRGRRFMRREHPAGDLAPRDVVARAIWRRLEDGDKVRLDARRVARLAQRFPTVFALCRRHGLDPRREALPVTPAAHYHMGGVAVDRRGRTSIGGLWACGEVASTGLHGANRLASNSLLEALVFGVRAAEDIARTRRASPAAAAPRAKARRGRLESRFPQALREAMWSGVGLVRSDASLAAALAALSPAVARGGSGEGDNLALVGWLIAAAARRRRESRGSHFRSDYPSERPIWRRRQFTTLTALAA